MSIRIAYVHTGLWPSPSPSMTFATGNVLGLAREADEVHFFIRKNSAEEPAAVLRRAFGWDVPGNLYIHRGPGRGLINTRWFYYRYLVSRLGGLCRERKVDAVITRATPFLPYLVGLGKKYGVAVFYETHDFFADLALRGGTPGTIKKRNSRLERKYLPSVTGLICLQNAQRDLYLHSFPDLPATVARTGIATVHQCAERTGNALGYIGSLDQHKGVEVLLKGAACSTVRPEIVIIGGKNPNEVRRCRDMAASLYDRDRVQVTGWIGKENLFRTLERFRAGVLPLRDTFFNRYLTSPLKLFDYFSVGIPVVCADLPTTRELVRENETGLFFTPGDAEALGRRIDDLYGLADAPYAAMRHRVHDAARQLTWEERARRQVAFIRTCMQKEFA